MKVKEYIKQSYRYILLLAMLTITTNLYAQFVDATRALEWKLYGDAVSKKMAEQEALQLTISGNHIYMHAQNGKIVDIQDEMNKYLSKFHDKLKLAAMCYSLYYECKTVVENVQSINKSISENPEGIICTAVVDQRGMIYLRLFSHTLSLINDVYQIFSNKKDEGDEDEARNKMTEKERIEQLDIVRKRIKKINEEMGMLAAYIKYTNINDVLNRILRTDYTFQSRTRQEIARDCLNTWRDHYSTENLLYNR